ncbi:hypothetical protein LAV73_08925 [Lysinibacillus xylanilyticus]|uniref:hypothetical protein n=1 Tax=Lysinibacillus xylanilyticus TaxID=582475 RepID=UPI002B240D9A|nr:hypothetical protein [Lysinibacillus xylanilyticus]MEB2280117.1 hypothetical protein [Lysinibacillus xylanilyticus]
MLEIYLLLGTFLLLVVIGALSALGESCLQRKESKWAFPAATNVENPSKTIQSIDEVSSYENTSYIDTTNNNIEEPDVLLEDNFIIYEEIVNNRGLGEFTHSKITEEVINNVMQIYNAINLEVNDYTECCNDFQMNNEVKAKTREDI